MFGIYSLKKPERKFSTILSGISIRVNSKSDSIDWTARVSRASVCRRKLVSYPPDADHINTPATVPNTHTNAYATETGSDHTIRTDTNLSPEYGSGINTNRNALDMGVFSSQQISVFPAVCR